MTNPLVSDRQPAPWTREQIRAARMALLVPLLEKRGLQLVESGGGNFLVREYAGLIVKDSYWRWPAAPKPGGGGPERDLGGNTIDFFVQVLGLSFHDAMKAITAS